VPASLEASWLIECRGSVKVVVGPRNQINKDKHKKPPVIKDQAAFLTANGQSLPEIGRRQRTGILDQERRELLRRLRLAARMDPAEIGAGAKEEKERQSI